MAGIPKECTHDAGRAPSRLHSTPFWLLGRVAQSGKRLTGERLVAMGLRPYWYAILATVEEFGPQAQAEIGRRLHVDPSDMVAAVNGLQDAGLVERTRDPDDRRRNLVAVTASGRERLGAFDDTIAAAEDEFLGALTAAERKTLVTLLRRVALS